MKCHVTGHGKPASSFGPKFIVAEEAVGCEACHGPGSEYKKMKVMKFSLTIKTVTVMSLALIAPKVALVMSG